MRNLWKKGVALVAAAAMCASVLGGCAKKAEAKPVYTFNGEAVNEDLTTFLMRNSQAGIDETYGAMFSSYYGQSMWTLDLSGTGEAYETTFKSEFGTTLEKLLLAEEHAADYSVELTDEEKAKITEVASKFLADNDKEALDAMKASQETVERALTLYTIQAKVDEEIGKGVDTNVSDDEAAQTSVSYIEYTPTVETEAETETAQTEADTVMTEAETAAVETEEADKTSSADETEAVAADAAAQTEAESETEDPAMTAAKEKYSAMAQDMLDSILSGAVEFEQASSDAEGLNDTGVKTGTFTYGKDDTYPAAEIMDAAAELADGEVAQSVVESGDSYYILHMDAVFDEEATADKKEEIVHERKHELIDSVYEDWMGKESWEVDAEALALIQLTDRVYSAPQTPETEADAAAEVTAETESAPQAQDTAMTETE